MTTLKLISQVVDGAWESYMHLGDDKTCCHVRARDNSDESLWWAKVMCLSEFIRLKTGDYPLDVVKGRVAVDNREGEMPIDVLIKIEGEWISIKRRTK